MGKPPPALLVSAIDQVAFIKINGRANFSFSVNFKTLVNELKDHGTDRFVLDLTECVTMDSTFLGVLASFALKMSDGNQSPEQSHMELINPNQRVSDLLDNLGVAHLFKTFSSAAPVSENFTPAAEVDANKDELSHTCLEAHQALMDINPANIPKFKEVTQFLAEDLKKA